MTDSEKIQRYDQVAEIVDQHLALLAYQKEEGVQLDFIEASKVFAYRKIAFVVTGTDPL